LDFTVHHYHIFGPAVITFFASKRRAGPGIKKETCMKFRTLLSFNLALIFLIFNSVACNGDEFVYDETVTAIENDMAGAPSIARPENYDYIRFNNCLLEYRVNGTYPSGGHYTLKYSDIDFSELNIKESGVVNDYAAFIELNFNKSAQWNNGVKQAPVRTVVIIVSDVERANRLFDEFKSLGEMCGAKKVQSKTGSSAESVSRN
jgi:hypothetical protein